MSLKYFLPNSHILLPEFPPSESQTSAQGVLHIPANLFDGSSKIPKNLKNSSLEYAPSPAASRNASDSTNTTPSLSNSPPLSEKSTSSNFTPIDPCDQRFTSQETKVVKKSKFGAKVFSQLREESPTRPTSAQLIFNEEVSSSCQPEDIVEEETSEPDPIEAQEEAELLSKGWTSDNDEQLRKLAAQYRCDWKKISKKFNNKKFTPHFLKIRYKVLIDAPVQRKIKFSHHEDLMLAKYYNLYGSDWTKISTFFKNRTGVMLKNRYYSHIRKRDLLGTLLKELGEDEKEREIPQTPSSISETEGSYLEKRPDFLVKNFEESESQALFFELNNSFIADELCHRVTPMIDSPSKALQNLFIPINNFQSHHSQPMMMNPVYNQSNITYQNLPYNNLQVPSFDAFPRYGTSEARNFF